ncbi:M20/M25/M40 family metallo-hydrolase [Desemzia sp. FAM 23991]|uniref:M20/M25/M40 family metallo-hydrolase n=1 Tax=unclassified Desemzia TaxID=2685243 RepID=UPI0038878BBD
MKQSQVIGTIEKAKEMASQRETEFYDYLRIESVSTQHRQIPETVAYVKGLIERTGGEVQVFDDLGGHPVIYGFFPASPNGNSERTLLFYNHYDVQPPEPLEEWYTEPFEPTVKDGLLYARGVSDNKANFMARLNALSILHETGDLSCNVKFLLEGEEEIGSPHLGPYIEKYAELFQADACIWEAGSKDKYENYVVSAGMKGIAYFDLEVTTAAIDIHSSMAAIIDNPAWRLVHALESMKNEHNEIVVEGFYDGISALSKQDKEAAAAQPFDPAEVKEQYGVTGKFITEGTDISPTEALAFYPTMTICGFNSGYTGHGIKTVLPKTAKAKLDCRLVPGQEPEHIYNCICHHLETHGYQDISVTMIAAEGAQRTSIDDPFIATVVSTAEKIYGADNPVLVSPSMAGTGPSELFEKYLHLPVAGVGAGWANSGAHAPNENIRLNDFYQNIAHMVELMKEFGAA